MKTILATVLLAGSLSLGSGAILSLTRSAIGQSQPNLSYRINGQQIPLTLRSDVLAVKFQPSHSRGDSQPAYQQLRQALQSSHSRSLAPTTDITVTPIGTQYAIVQLPHSRDLTNSIQTTLQEQAYVAETLPVLSRPDRTEAILLPNEIILNLQPGLSDAQRQAWCDRQGIELIRPLRFTQNSYLVRSKTASGTAVLAAIDQLAQAKGVISASPNFIAAQLPNQLQAGDRHHTWPHRAISRNADPTANSAHNLLALQWHLDSTAQRQNAPRTDLHATNAWQTSRSGKGVVVAVLDWLIEWDHPNLMHNVYTVGNVANKLPQELHGWDFVDDDPDTGISPDELAVLREPFQDAIRMRSQGQIPDRYQSLVRSLKQEYPGLSGAQLVNEVSDYLLNQVAGEFHGTMVAGVIAAQPNAHQGVAGVAPQATILPVRVGAIGGGASTRTVIEAVHYAAQRGADIINLSLGSLPPTPAQVEAISDELRRNPKLVIVVAAGNENLDRVSFPALVKGVVAVGATNLSGERSPYSSYGVGIDVVAPGGDTSQSNGGILTTGGTWQDGFWQGISPIAGWSPAQDAKGLYVWTQGTSFAAPAVAGVLALMKGEDPQRHLTRDRLITILKSTASYKPLKLSSDDDQLYRLLQTKSKLMIPGSAQQYFFGSGLVNAEAAVQQVQRSR